MEFDRSSTEHSLAENTSVLKSTEAEIEQVRAQGRLAEEQDLTALTKARFDLSVAKLEASKREIVSRIEGEQAKLRLADAEEKVREVEAKLDSDRVAIEAKVRAKKQESTKAKYEVNKAERSLAAMVVRSPEDGTVSLEKTWRPEGRSAFRPGDRAWPGAPIAQVPEIATIRIAARVDESERGRLSEGLPVAIQLDAIPDKQLRGRIQSISTIASADFTAGWPFPKNFSLEIALDESDPRLRPGMSAQLGIEIEHIRDALVIPSSAVFDRNGKPVVYVLHGRNFDERPIEVSRRSGSRIMVGQGLQHGDRIALKDPREAKEK